MAYDTHYVLMYSLSQSSALYMCGLFDLFLMIMPKFYRQQQRNRKKMQTKVNVKR